MITTNNSDVCGTTFQVLDPRTSYICSFKYSSRPCSCGGPGWTKVAYLICQTLTNTVRPTGLSLHLQWEDVGVQRVNVIHVTVVVQGQDLYFTCMYRINAYGRGWLCAFNHFQYKIKILDQSYISGVSVTHGPADNGLLYNLCRTSWWIISTHTKCIWHLTIFLR